MEPGKEKWLLAAVACAGILSPFLLTFLTLLGLTHYAGIDTRSTIGEVRAYPKVRE